MAVKGTGKGVCGKVRLRRDAVSGHPNAPLVSSPRPRTLGSVRYTDDVHPFRDGPLSPMSSPEISEDTPSMPERSRRDEMVDCRGLSVDWVLDCPYGDVIKLLQRLDMFADSDLIVEIMLHYSLVIRGLPDCPNEDLPLAVYLFVEDTFSIRSRLVKCVKIRRYDGKMDVGVVFDTIRMKYEVLRKDELLKDTEVRMVNNHTLTWFAKFPSSS